MKYCLDATFLGENFSYDLVNGCFIRPSEKENLLCSDFETIAAQESLLRENSDFLCITIALTDACNLNCTYCFEKHGKLYLSPKNILHICTLIREYKIKRTNTSRVIIIWFGGEPVLNLDFISKATPCIKKTCQELGLNYSSRIITNGIELDKILPHIVDFSITDIQITLDGTKEFHDKRRITQNGLGTFNKIISNILKIDDYVDLIVRMNVDKDNISECAKLYDYISQLPFSSKVKVFFQPMLVENYGGESTCYDGMILTDEKLNERYLDLLEYTGNLEFPKYIGAVCNISFPGSLVIRSDGSLCKCWAKVVEYGKIKNSIEDDVDRTLEFMKKENVIRRQGCKECEIYPACLGGCVYKNIKPLDCHIKYKTTLSTIYRLYFKCKVKDNVSFKIMNNEIEWLKSIGCEIQYQDGGIKIEREDLQTEDFNFFVGSSQSESCIRLSQMMLGFEKEEAHLLSLKYEKQKVYDINYFFSNRAGTPFDNMYIFEDIPFEKWGNDGVARNSNRFTKYYNIWYKEKNIGKFSVIVTNIVGIYDFEIFNEYQRLGHGVNVLRAIMSQTKYDLYIQTWSENDGARRCYEKAGFKEYEILYRYNIPAKEILN